jgi:hypothetical protein
MSKATPYNAEVRYRYDGEHESILLTVNATSTKQARELAREEAQGILEEGIPFRITNVAPRDQQWAKPWCVFKISEMNELAPMLTAGKDPRADVRVINAYLERVGRWDALRAKQVRPSLSSGDGDMGIMVLWNEQVSVAC